jgi:hypothetical protein
VGAARRLAGVRYAAYGVSSQQQCRGDADPLRRADAAAVELELDGVPFCRLKRPEAQVVPR